jgi:hypothetical protein
MIRAPQGLAIEELHIHILYEYGSHKSEQNNQTRAHSASYDHFNL